MSGQRFDTWIVNFPCPGWHGMKRDIATFIACCDSCQRIKAEHQKPAGLLQPNKIPEWKWDEIGMDFIVGLPRS